MPTFPTYTTDLVLNDATKINLMPLRAINMYHSGGGEEPVPVFTEISNLESESSFELRGITRTGSGGQTRTVGYRYNLVGICPQNNLKDYARRFEYLRLLKGGVDVQLLFGTSSGPLSSSPSHGQINSTAGLWIDTSGLYAALSGKPLNFRFNWEVEQVEFRPRLIVRMSGVLHALVSTNGTTNIFGAG